MLWIHYRSLLYKNWILWKRNLSGSLCEILVPIFFFLVFAAIRQIVPKEDKDGLSYLNKAVYVSSDPTISVSFPYPEGNSFTDCAYYTSKGGE